MKIKKIILIGFIAILLTGCTVVRIDTKSIDNMLSVILSKDNTLYNRVGKGYKYYIPRGVNYIDGSNNNDKLYSNGVYYYLYLDEIGYYYKSALDFEEDSTKFYSKKIDNDDKKGYLEITKLDTGYLVEFVYNYAKIEALVTNEKEINDVVLNSSYILSTIKYNNDIVKLALEEDFLKNKEEKYNVFTPKKESDSSLKLEEGKD